MTKTDRRIEELTDAIRKLTDEVERLRTTPRLAPYVPYYPPYWVQPYYPPVYVPYSQPTITWGVGTQVSGGGICGSAGTSAPGFAVSSNVNVANLPAGTSFSYTVE